MPKAITFRRWVIVTFLSLFLVSPLAFAQGKGRGRTGGNPPKRGWHTNVPPGIEKKGDWMPPGLSNEKQGQEEGAPKRHRSKKRSCETESEEAEKKMDEATEEEEEATEEQVSETQGL